MGVTNEGIQLVRTKDRLVYRKRASGRRDGVEERRAVATPKGEVCRVAMRCSGCSVRIWSCQCDMRLPRIHMRRGRGLWKALGPSEVVAGGVGLDSGGRRMD